MFRFLMGLILGPAIGFAVVFSCVWLLPNTDLGGHNVPISILMFSCLGSIAIWTWPLWRSKRRDLAKGPTDYHY